LFTAAMAVMSPATPFLITMACVLMGRVGLGLISTPLNLSSVHGLAPDDISQAVSMTSFMRQLGGAMGVSIVGIALEWRLKATGVTLADPSISPERKADAFDQLFLGLAVTILLAAIAAWKMKPRAAARA